MKLYAAFHALSVNYWCGFPSSRPLGTINGRASEFGSVLAHTRLNSFNNFLTSVPFNWRGMDVTVVKLFRIRIDFLSTEPRPSFRCGLFSGTILGVNLPLAADEFFRNFFLCASELDWTGSNVDFDSLPRCTSCSFFSRPSENALEESLSEFLPPRRTTSTLTFLLMLSIHSFFYPPLPDPASVASFFQEQFWV